MRPFTDPNLIQPQTTQPQTPKPSYLAISLSQSSTAQSNHLEKHVSYTDHELLQLFQAEDDQAFRLIYERYADKVYSLAYLYLKSAVNAQDISQEVFIKLWNKRKEMSGVESIGAWLQVVTRNTVIDSLRKKSESFESKEMSTKVSPEEEFLSKETARMLREAIDSLSPRQREIYRLSREEGHSYSKIAGDLGIAQETVKEHMKQALKNIRGYLVKHLGIILFILLHK